MIPAREPYEMSLWADSRTDLNTKCVQRVTVRCLVARKAAEPRPLPPTSLWMSPSSIGLKRLKSLARSELR